MQNKEIENAEILAQKIYRIQEYILTEIKEKGEISDFKEDVMYVIHNLLEIELSKEELTACEIVMKNQEARIRIEHEKRIQRYINQLENKVKELEATKDKYLQKLIYALTPTTHVLDDYYNNTFKQIIADNIDLETCKIKRKLKEFWGIDKY